MTITALPTPPSRLNPVNFSERADAFLGALPQFVNEANSLEALTQYNALVGSCTNTLSIATGTKTISTQTNKAWVAGMYVYLIYPTDYTQTMTGTVSSYNASSGALIVNVTQVTGSGSYSNWNIVTVNPPQSAANISGGSAGQILYQTAANTTGFMHPANAIAIVNATGTANAITATFVPAITSLVDGMIVFVRAIGDNTSTTVTFSPNGLASKPIYCENSTRVIKGSIRSGKLLELQYSSSENVWFLLNPTYPEVITRKSPTFNAVSGTNFSISMRLDYGQYVGFNYPDTVGSTDKVDYFSQSDVSSLTIPNGATLGMTSGAKERLAVLLLTSDFSAYQIGVVNARYAVNLNESKSVSVTAISASSNSDLTVYATTGGARYFRVIGYIEYTPTTAGVWTYQPTACYSVISNEVELFKKRYVGSVTTTGASAFAFTGFPAWVNKITVVLSAVSTTGTNQPFLRLLDQNSSALTTGYAGVNTFHGGSATGANPNLSIGIGNWNAAVDIRHGAVEIYRVSPTTWVYKGVLGLSNANTAGNTAGTLTLSAGVSISGLQIAVTTDTFDSGTATVILEA